MNMLIGWIAKLSPIDSFITEMFGKVGIPEKGKTIIGVVFLLGVNVTHTYFPELITAETLAEINKYTMIALGVTVSVKLPRAAAKMVADE